MILTRILDELIRPEEFISPQIADGTHIADGRILAEGNGVNTNSIINILGAVRYIDTSVSLGNLSRGQIANGSYLADGFLLADGTHIVVSPQRNIIFTRVSNKVNSIASLITRRGWLTRKVASASNIETTTIRPRVLTRVRAAIVNNISAVREASYLRRVTSSIAQIIEVRRTQIADGTYYANGLVIADGTTAINIYGILKHLDLTRASAAVLNISSLSIGARSLTRVFGTVLNISSFSIRPRSLARYVNMQVQVVSNQVRARVLIRIRNTIVNSISTTRAVNFLRRIISSVIQTIEVYRTQIANGTYYANGLVIADGTTTINISGILRHIDFIRVFETVLNISSLSIRARVLTRVRNTIVNILDTTSYMRALKKVIIATVNILGTISYAGTLKKVIISVIKIVEFYAPQEADGEYIANGVIIASGENTSNPMGILKALSFIRVLLMTIQLNDLSFRLRGFTRYVNTQVQLVSNQIRTRVLTRVRTAIVNSISTTSYVRALKKVILTTVNILGTISYAGALKKIILTVIKIVEFYAPQEADGEYIANGMIIASGENISNPTSILKALGFIRVLLMAVQLNDLSFQVRGFTRLVSSTLTIATVVSKFFKISFVKVINSSVSLLYFITTDANYIPFLDSLTILTTTVYRSIKQLTTHRNTIDKR